MTPNEALAATLAITTALAATAFAVLVGLAAPAPAPQPATAAAIPAACREWTDGCIICTRTPQGPACSTPGIACLRETPRCLRQ